MPVAVEMDIDHPTVKARHVVVRVCSLKVNGDNATELQLPNLNQLQIFSMIIFLT